jgi:uncharacterized protein YhfF
MERTAAVRAFWAAYKSAAGLTHERYTVARPGDRPELASELAELMLAGTKRATASLARDFEVSGEPLPQPGDYVVVVDGAHLPRCIWRTTEVTVKPLIEVDDALPGTKAKAIVPVLRGWTVTGAISHARQAAKASRCTTGSRPCSSASGSSGRSTPQTAIKLKLSEGRPGTGPAIPGSRDGACRPAP